MNEWVNKHTGGKTFILLVSLPLPRTSESPSLALFHWALLTFYKPPTMPTRESQPMCSPAPSAETTKQPQKQVPRQCRGPRSWCSREQSLVLPTHKLHRASGAPAGRRENPDQNRQGGGPGKKLLATTLLISVSINLYDTLETSEREQSRLEKKKDSITKSLPPPFPVLGPARPLSIYRRTKQRGPFPCWRSPGRKLWQEALEKFLKCCPKMFNKPTMEKCILREQLSCW